MALLRATLCAADAPTAQRTPMANTAAAATLAALYEEYFEARLRRYPSSATFNGDHRYDGRLENPASAAFTTSAVAEQRDFLARARAVDTDGLNASQRLSYAVFVSDRELALERLSFPDRLLPIDQMSSLASTFAQLGSGSSAQPFDTVADYEAFLGRADGFSQWVDDAILAMREGMARGVVNPRIIMERVVPQLRDIARPGVEQSLFWQPVRNMPAHFSDAERARLTAAYRDAITRVILPAYRRLAQFIERDYLPMTRSSVGLWALPNGDAWYRHQIRKHTSTDMSADDIHALGQREMVRIRAEMLAVMAELDFKGDLAAFQRHLQADPRLNSRHGDDVIVAFTALKKRINAAMPRLFHALPRADFEIRPVEAFRAASAAGASYQPPSADGSRPGIFYVNTHPARGQPVYGMATLALHEAMPGHHYQFAMQQELHDLPRFQRFNSFKAYVEGWALYAESLGHELGLYHDPLQHYGHLNDEMLRAMRLVVDTGLHARRWSREQAMSYMRANCSLADEEIAAEVERYIAWPGQALSYKIGQLRISALRARAERELGTAFDLRDFHAEVLRDGPLPMPILEDKLSHWITQQRQVALGN
ncbi:MAG: DUF885 domain-containing protein [Gammaproteobacteria bacterium]|nr:DUF885 domain-containing protein [Gammaproteobacteria bacterium]